MDTVKLDEETLDLAHKALALAIELNELQLLDNNTIVGRYRNNNFIYGFGDGFQGLPKSKPWRLYWSYKLGYKKGQDVAFRNSHNLNICI